MIHDHIRALAVEIGPRGSGTENEQRALQYCAEVLKGMGLEVEESAFRSVASAYRPFILVSLLALAAFALSFPDFRDFALVLAAVAGVSALLEIAFLPNPLMLLLPRRKSGNILAKVPAIRAPRRKIVLVAHVDTHRTPWIWRSPTTYKLYRVLSSLGVFAFLGLPFALYFQSVLFAVLAGLGILAVLLMTLQAEMTPYTPGANDNASGVAMVLELAQYYRKAPLEETEMWFACVGCEEVGAHGARAFVRRYRDQLADARVLVIDNIAGRDTSPRYYLGETMLRPLHPPDDIIAIAEKIALEHPETYAMPFQQKGAYTDATPFHLADIPCLAVVNHRTDGWIPDWHSMTDTIDRIDDTALDRARRFIHALIVEFAR